MKTTILLSMLTVLGQADVPEKAAAPTPTQMFRGVLGSPGGELPFLFELAPKPGGGLDGWLINGPEKTKIDQVIRIKDVLILSIERYAAEVYLTGRDWVPLGDEMFPMVMEGNWNKRIAAHDRVRLDADANVYPGYLFKPIPEPPHAKPSYPSVDGRWRVQFSESKAPAVGVFKQSEEGTVVGTFLTSTGDYRYLSGSYEFGRLRLSVFDGAHAFLFDAKMQEDGSLKGDFWSRKTWQESWVATRDDSVDIPDGFDIVHWKKDAGFGEARYSDLKGNLFRLDHPKFKGKARIIEVFGSWCPNCHDAADWLVELDKRYRDKGLKILGLAFEVTGEFQHDVKQVRRFVRLHKIEFPVVIGGMPSGAAIKEALPFLETTHAYPTTIFLREDGTVRAVYTGFSGPATGPMHESLKKRQEAIVKELLGLPAEK